MISLGKAWIIFCIQNNGNLKKFIILSPECINKLYNKLRKIKTRNIRIRFISFTEIKTYFYFQFVFLLSICSSFIDGFSFIEFRLKLRLFQNSLFNWALPWDIFLESAENKVNFLACYLTHREDFIWMTGRSAAVFLCVCF